MSKRLDAIVLALAVGWFFGFRMPAGIPGVMATTVVGPFQSEAHCHAVLDEIKDQLEGVPGVQFVQCSEAKQS